jgi:hypothetical protein
MVRRSAEAGVHLHKILNLTPSHAGHAEALGAPHAMSGVLCAVAATVPRAPITRARHTHKWAPAVTGKIFPDDHHNPHTSKAALRAIGSAK